MAQSSSLTREPSMEEILASIRRIIEESDTTRPDEALPLAVNSDVPSQSAAVPGLSEHYEEEAELAPREGIAVSLPTQSTYDSAFERAASPLRSKRVEPEYLPEPPAPSVTPSALQHVEEHAEYVGVEAGISAAPEEAVNAPIEEPIEAPVAAAPMTAPAIEHFETSVDKDMPLDLERSLEPILSETAERQVSAAFDDLSFAVRSEQRRSFDEIAQEIMRPLLQDWLDNNLPTLVERLVREEIERVARGGRR